MKRVNVRESREMQYIFYNVRNNNIDSSIFQKITSIFYNIIDGQTHNAIIIDTDICKQLYSIFNIIEEKRFDR